MCHAMQMRTHAQQVDNCNLVTVYMLVAGMCKQLAISIDSPYALCLWIIFYNHRQLDFRTDFIALL